MSFCNAKRIGSKIEYLVATIMTSCFSISSSKISLKTSYLNKVSSGGNGTYWPSWTFIVSLSCAFVNRGRRTTLTTEFVPERPTTAFCPFMPASSKPFFNTSKNFSWSWILPILQTLESIGMKATLSRTISFFLLIIWTTLIELSWKSNPTTAFLLGLIFFGFLETFEFSFLTFFPGFENLEKRPFFGEVFTSESSEESFLPFFKKLNNAIY